MLIKRNIVQFGLVVVVLMSGISEPYTKGEIQAATVSNYYTNEEFYLHKFGTDADSIDYQLYLGERRIDSGRVELDNPNGRDLKAELSLQLAETGVYRLRLITFDEVLNRSEHAHVIAFNKERFELEIVKVADCGGGVCAEISLGREAEIHDEVRGGELAEFGSHEKVQVLEKWEHNQSYQIRLRARDRYGNIVLSNLKTFQAPDRKAGSGHMYGSSPSQPWGKDIRYNESATASATLDLLSMRLDLTDLAIPAPILTLARRSGEKVTSYGHAPSKSTPLRVSGYLRYPSYLQAELICTGRNSRTYRKHIRNSTRSCIARSMGISDLGDYYGRIERICSSLNPISYINCLDYRFGQRESRYLGEEATTLDHVRLSLQTSGMREVGHQWQEREDNFSIKSSNLERVAVRATAYGELTIAGAKASYKIDSSISNFLTPEVFKSPDKSVEKRCGNTGCKVLPVPYFNQAVDSNGRWEYWPGWHELAGGQSCGAASSVMTLGYLGKLSSSHRLKSYAFQDNGNSLHHKKCNRGGGFAVTAYNHLCNQSSLAGINNYLGQYGVRTRTHWLRPGEENRGMGIVRNAIDDGRPLIISYTRPIGHILVIRGYTYNNQIVVNDPYRDIQNNFIRARYDYSGREAIYSLRPNANFQINYILEIL